MARKGGSYFKRYLAYRSFRAAEDVGKATAGCLGGTVKLFLYIFGLLLVISIIGMIIPYVLIAVAVVALIVLIVWLVRRKKKK